MKDKNGIEIKKGQTVNVPEPNETDNYAFEFTGTVVNFDGEHVVVSDSDFNYFEIEPERLEVDETQQVNTIRYEILKAMKNWLEEADNETLERVFNENFDGNLIYNSEIENFSIDTDEAQRLGITAY